MTPINLDKEGWWWPSNSRKAHYMVEGRSLCKKWGCVGNPHLEKGNDNSPDNCAPCRRALGLRTAVIQQPGFRAQRMKP